MKKGCIDQRIKMRDGWVLSVDISINVSCNLLEMMHAQATHKAYIIVNTLHELLGHISEAMTRKTAKEMNVMLTGIFEPCKACALGKAKKAYVLKILNEHSA